MSEKTLNTRIVHKHDVEANWLKAVNFTPKQGEIIVYDIDDTYNYERLKIGDGKTLVSNLPFADDAIKALLPLIVNLDTDDNGNFITDYTREEICSVFDSGRPIYLNDGEGYLMPLIAVGSQAAVFGILDSDGHHSIVLVRDDEVIDKARNYISSINGQAAPNDGTGNIILDFATDTDITQAINSHNISETAHSDIRTSISDLSDLVGDTSVSEQIAASNMIYVGPDQPTDPNIKVWINTAEEGTGVVPVLPRVATISLPKASWTGSAAPYSQTVSINTVTSATKIDLQPTVAQITSLQNDDIALMAENTDGVVKIYSFGGKPSSDMTMQVLLTEVSYV